MPRQLIMMRGLPASGKSTKAKEMSSSMGSANVKIVNKDQLRLMLDCGVWSKDNEKFVLKIRDHIVSTSLMADKAVIVDDTNLAPFHEAALKVIAEQCGATFEVVDFTHVSVEECVKRDQKRQNYVGETTIRDMAARYLTFKAELKVAEQDASLTPAIIVDIDGTVALINGRSPFDWSKVGEDLPNQPVLDLVLLMDSFAQILFVSGRDARCRAATEAWLTKHTKFKSPVLWMRPEGDTRDDRIIKKEIYENEIKGRYFVKFVLDDRNKVVDQWRDMGLPCFQVAPGNF